MFVIRTLRINVVQEIELSPKLIEHDPYWPGIKISVGVWPNLSFVANELGVNEARLWREVQKISEDLAAEILGVPVTALNTFGWGIGPSLVFGTLEPVDIEKAKQRIERIE